MPFTLLPCPKGGPQHARFDESLISLAINKGPVACIWTAKQGLVVPRTYQRHASFQASCEQSAQTGWPITIRQTGGGIVPQGPGIINLSLAYSVHGKPMDHSDAAYQLICRIISQALLEFGIHAYPGAVEGSFCDGRYNLAIDQNGQARKVAGTAQMWRKHPAAGAGSDHQIVLVHALILANADVKALCNLANHFEQMLGSNKSYDSDRVASLHACLNPPASHTDDWVTQLQQALTQQIALLA